MILSLNWLKNYIPDFDYGGDIEAFKDKVDTRLSELDSVRKKGDGLSGLVIGIITDVDKVPNRDKISVCKVNDGTGEEKTVICGAPNVRVGLKTIYCVPGGKVYDPQTKQLRDITEKDFAGFLSKGMLCSRAELGLGTEHDGIIEIEDDTLNAGTPVAQKLQDIVIEIENKNLAHRPDTFSHLGIARELSAIYGVPVEQGEDILPSMLAEEEVEVKVSIQAEDLCTRYSGIAITGITVKPSPLWLQVALSYVGIRPINNVVDATNYVMLDMGQPLHAFDLSKLESKQILVRKSRKGEKVMTLDSQERELPEDSLVITDGTKPIAIAGIMGGESTEIDDKTTSIFLEAANFEMYSIRRTSRDLGLRSDASARFEKGIDPAITIDGLTKAAGMILDLCGGELASEMIDVYPKPEAPVVVNFDLSSIKRLLGIELNKSELLDTLESLNFEILESEKVAPDALVRADINAEVEIQIPTYRRDIKAQEDILEEIARLYGYENFPKTLPKRDLKPANSSQLREKLLTVKKTLAGAGLNEIVTYSMVGEELYQNAMLSSKRLLKLAQPLSPELALVRSHITPSILEKVQQNVSKYPEYGMFELSRVVHADRTADNLPKQPFMVAGVRVGNSDEDAYRKLAYAIEQLSNEMCAGKLRIIPPTNGNKLFEYLHPGKSGSIVLDNEPVGNIGIVHPMVLENFGLENLYVAVFEVEIDPILNMDASQLDFKPVSNYQAVLRDVSFWQDQGAYIGNLTHSVKQANVDLLEDLEVIDVFKKDDKQSVTVRLTLQSAEDTLTKEQIDEVIKKVVELGRKQGFQVRE